MTAWEHYTFPSWAMRADGGGVNNMHPSSASWLKSLHARSAHRSSDHFRSAQISSYHARSAQRSSDHLRSTQISSNHAKSAQRSSDDCRSAQIMPDHARSTQRSSAHPKSLRISSDQFRSALISQEYLPRTPGLPRDRPATFPRPSRDLPRPFRDLSASSRDPPATLAEGIPGRSELSCADLD